MKQKLLSFLILICLSLNFEVFAQGVPARVNCPMCLGGSVVMPCMQCAGRGSTMQYGYGGYPMQTMCGACRGAGKFCGYCGNQGSIRNPVAGYPVKPLMEGGIRCMQCYGTGYWICSMCSGMTPQVYRCSFCNNGVGACSMCAGSGTFFGTSNYGGYSGSTSSSSSGSSYGGSSSSSSSSSSAQKTCTKIMASDIAHCNGSGVCAKCNGRKYYYDSTFGTRHLVDPCVTCGGSGKCPSCHGTGKKY